MAEDLDLDCTIADLIAVGSEDIETDYGLPCYGPFLKPLSEIRLIRICYADTDTRSQRLLECDVLPAPLHQRNNPTPPFVAISYTWGPPSPTKNLLVNGKLCTVRYNLFYALWQAYHFVESGTFIWIDGLCIDQSNTEERGNQVQLMGSIYEQAERVLACIGSHADNSEIVFRWNRPENLQRYDEEALGRSLDALCQRPYWTRLWIVQECALASSLVLLCSKDSLHAGELHEMVKYRSSTSIVPQLLDWSWRKESDLLTLMKRFADQKCTEIKDRAYALYGLRGKDPPGHEIYVRYEESTLQIAQDVVYVSNTNAVRGLLEAFRILKIDLRDETVLKLLRERKQHTYIHPNEGIGLNFNSHQYLWYEEYEDPVFQTLFYSYAVLEGSEAGNLDISSTYRFPPGESPSTTNENALFNAIWDHNGKELRCGPILLGRVSELTEPGDLIVWQQIEEENGRPGNEIFGLIVRHRQGYVYRIIGIAMLHECIKGLRRLAQGLTEAARAVPPRANFRGHFETEDLALMLLLIHGNRSAEDGSRLQLNEGALKTCREACNKPLTRMAYSSHVRIE